MFSQQPVEVKLSEETGHPWMEEAMQLAAQCWCDPETEDRIMDTELAKAVAKRIEAWMDTAAMFHRNADYYRGLLDRIGNAIGEPAHICDDGSRSDEILRAKLPELIEALISSRSQTPTDK